MNNTTPTRPYCDYSFFLFSKLYDAQFKPEYEIDLQYEDVCTEFGKYCDSEFNDDKINEYDCIVDYLKSIDTK